jgi:thiamine pyrophosphate-dependent acetolactate synthase large subunit-like protein
MPAVVIVYTTTPGHVDRQSAKPGDAERHLFQENVRYDKVGEALGAHGEYVTRPRGLRPALERAYQIAKNESRPAVINCQAKRNLDQGHPPASQTVEPGCMSYYH